MPVFFLLFLVIRFLLWQFLVDCVRGLLGIRRFVRRRVPHLCGSFLAGFCTSFRLEVYCCRVEVQCIFLHIVFGGFLS